MSESSAKPPRVKADQLPQQAWPNVWSDGQLMGFSGLEGPTPWDTMPSFSTLAEPVGLQLRLPAALSGTMLIEGMDQLQWKVVLGDVAEGRAATGDVGLVMIDALTLMGQLPPSAALTFDGEVVEPRLRRECDDVRLDMHRRGERFVFRVSHTDQAQASDFDALLATPWEHAVEARKAFYRGLTLPGGLSVDEQRLYLKAASVLKINVMSPGEISDCRWTTPDRWPHRVMALWDSVFHALGWMHLDPSVARDAIDAMLQHVQDDGFLTHLISPIYQSPHTQPPVLAYGVWQVHQAEANLDWLAASIDPIERHLKWIEQHRDPRGTGLYGWLVQDKPNCRCGESGLDNTPPLDLANPDNPPDAPDLSAYVAHAYQHAAKIRRALGDESTADAHDLRAAQITQRISEQLWSAKAGFLLFRDPQGRLIEVKTIAGFMGLLTDLPDRQAAVLAGHLNNPQTFGSSVPIATTAIDEPVFCKDMWRGPVWMNANELVRIGLQRHRMRFEAENIRQRCVRELSRWYESKGCLYEFYDCMGTTPPHDLDRKQRLTTGKGMAPIEDYGWTAAMAIRCLES